MCWMVMMLNLQNCRATHSDFQPQDRAVFICKRYTTHIHVCSANIFYGRCSIFAERNTFEKSFGQLDVQLSRGRRKLSIKREGGICTFIFFLFLLHVSGL